MSELHRLAAEAGLHVEWEDAAGRPMRVSDETLRKVLERLGYPAENADAIAMSLDRCLADKAKCAFLTAEQGQAFELPTGCAHGEKAEIHFENGGSETLSLDRDSNRLIVPPIDTIGYHRLIIDGREIDLAVAPPQCFSVEDCAPGTRPWGTAVQIPSLRSQAGGAFGDFGTLASAARELSAEGADAIAISPAHALFPADASRYSPYSPSSRLFLNILYADAALIGQPVEEPDDGSDLIDWAVAIPRRLQILRDAFTRTRETLRETLQQFREESGKALKRHAIYDALHARFFADGARGWQDWPDEYHDPDGDAVRRFAEDHPDEVDFYIFAQWLAKESLAHAHSAAKDAGMTIGLISDLAVGMDGGGSHGWSSGEELLHRLSIGAPPDPLGPDGQDWGLTTFSPMALKRTGFAGFIDTVRSALAHAGGIRIDHILGLNRLWVVPHGSPSSDGVYVDYPLQDMLRILALESHRARAIVIGEDLGTVPDGLRPELEARQVLGMRVLWFERDENRFVPPEKWDHQAVAMTGTHDLPTLAGWWSGRDIDWTWKLGRKSEAQDEQSDRRQRAIDRKRIWDALVRSGSASGPMPDATKPDGFVDAALKHVGSTPSCLAIVPLEDIAGLKEQPNLPGTIDEHPNWRRRMPEPLAQILERPQVGYRLRLLEESRR